MPTLDARAASGNSPSAGNPFWAARQQLNLSPKELADKLNTSFYALVRWERGDQRPSADILSRLAGLLDPAPSAERRDSAPAPDVVFESNGARTPAGAMPLFPPETVAKLDAPRDSILSELMHGDLWDDGDIALADILARRTAPAATRDTPLGDAISAGKNTYTYDAHTYHTKVPPQGIANVIARYLPQGGVVLDPFAGSGMTGVAARYLGHDVILNELSPAAGFIARNFLKRVDPDQFLHAVAHVAKSLAALRDQLYRTECRECGKPAELQFVVWSYRLQCDCCGHVFVLWDHCRRYGRTVREHKLLRTFPCPDCGEEITKSRLKRFEPVPVFVGYKCCSKKIVEHPPTAVDLAHIEDAAALVDAFRDDFPDHALPSGDNLNQPKRHGLDSIEKFYTPRNLVACAALWREIRKIEDPDLAAALGFVFTSLYQRVTRLSEYRFWGGSGNTANFNVPQIFNEANVFLTFERKAKTIADHFATTAVRYSGRSVVRTGSATDLGFLPDESVDFVFTDPPFGGNINYSEMNILWEAWLDAFTVATDEVIINRSQGKTVDSYETLMRRSLAEVHRVLRQGSWMVLVFMNSSEKVWTALRRVIERAGFSIETINIFDKQHGTFKQFVSDNTSGADLMIHCRKASHDMKASPAGVLPQASVTQFIEAHRNDIPVLPFLHVKRRPEVDYRTLYSRYLAGAIEARRGIAGFADFRKQAVALLEDHNR